MGYAMKVCGKCKDTLPLEAFNKNASSEDGLHKDCRKCKKKYQAEWYQKHKEEHKARTAKWRVDNYAILRQRYDELKSGPCTDCGGVFDPICMDWDHLPEFSKIAGVSELVAHSLETIKAEIAKCELVCANCHRIRTRDRQRKSN